MKKNILIISYSYPPSNAPAAQRPYAVAKYLNKEKYNVTLITCGNPDSSLGFDKEFNETLPNVKAYKINSLIGKSGASLRESKMSQKTTLKTTLKKNIFQLFSYAVIPDKGIFWLLPVLRFLRNNLSLIKQTDIVFTTSPLFSNHLIGKFIKRKNKSIVWLAEFRDFHYLERHTNRGIKALIDARLEYSIIKKATKVSFISHAMKNIYSQYYSLYEHKMGVVYNGFDLSDFKKIEIKPTTNKKLTIFYAGSFYRGVRSPIPLLKILDKLIEEELISANEVNIKIAGNFENELLDDVKKFKSYASISFLGNIPRKEVLKNLAVADLLWLIVGDKPTHYTGVPIKFFEYLAVRRPIINFAPEMSEPTKLINEHNLGWNFDTRNFKVNNASTTFLDIIEKYKMGELSYALPKKEYPQFSREQQAKMFENMFY